MAVKPFNLPPLSQRLMSNAHFGHRAQLIRADLPRVCSCAGSLVCGTGSDTIGALQLRIAGFRKLLATGILPPTPGVMQLPYLQPLTGIAGDKSNTIVFPVPGGFKDLPPRPMPSGSGA